MAEFESGMTFEELILKASCFSFEALGVDLIRVSIKMPDKTKEIFCAYDLTFNDASDILDDLNFAIEQLLEKRKEQQNK
jgi:hypothetical protein